MAPLTRAGETVTVTCRECGGEFSYAYSGQGPLRSFHQPEDQPADAPVDPITGKKRDCRRVHNNQKLRPNRALEAAVKRLMDQDPEVDALLRVQWADALDCRVKEEARRMRKESERNFRTWVGVIRTSRTQKFVSEDGFLLDLSQAQRGPLRRDLAAAEDAGRTLQGQKYGRRDAHATLALYRDAMAKRFLPLLGEISRLLED